MTRETRSNPEAKREETRVRFKDYVEHRDNLQQYYYQRVAKQLRDGNQALELADYAPDDEMRGRPSNAEVVMTDDEAIEKILAKVKALDELRAKDPDSLEVLVGPKSWKDYLGRIRKRYDLRERLSGMIGDTIGLQARNNELGKPVSDEAIGETQRGTLYYLDSLLARHEALDRLDRRFKELDKKD